MYLSFSVFDYINLLTLVIPKKNSIYLSSMMFNTRSFSLGEYELLDEGLILLADYHVWCLLFQLGFLFLFLFLFLFYLTFYYNYKPINFRLYNPILFLKLFFFVYLLSF